MKTNSINKTLDMYNKIEHLEEENKQLKEKNKDYKKILEILEQWFKDTEEQPKNNSMDLGTY